jgi:hypothetical protein
VIYSRQGVLSSPWQFATVFLGKGHETGNVLAEPVFCLKDIRLSRLNTSRAMQALPSDQGRPRLLFRLSAHSDLLLIDGLRDLASSLLINESLKGIQT